MKLSKTLWYMSFLITAVFLMPVFADTPLGQLDSFDSIAAEGWVDTHATGRMLQAPPGEVNESTGSMKINFQPGITDHDIEVVRTFSPVLNFNDYQNLAITLWVWSDKVNNSKLKEIILYDSIVNHTGRFAVSTLKNVGWNKVIAPLRNFSWTEYNAYTPLPPKDVLWDKIAQIGLWTSCNPIPGNPIYMDNLRLEVAPNAPAMPYQMASFDNIAAADEDWYDDRGTGLMRQSPPGEVNEGTGSMRMAFTQRTPSNWDIEPRMALIPALDFTARQDWAITMWVWTDHGNDVNNSRLHTALHEIILSDAAGHKGRYRVPIPYLPASTGWQKVTANLMEFIWEDSYGIIISPDDVCLDAILSIGLWTTCYGVTGNDFNDIYMDDLRVEKAAKNTYQQIMQKYPDSPYADKAQINIPRINILSLIDSENDAGTQAALDALIADFNDHPHLPDAMLFIAEKYYEKGVRPEVKQEISKKMFNLSAELLEKYVLDKISGKDNEVLAYYIAALSNYRLGNADKTIEFADKVLQINPDHQYVANMQWLIADGYERMKTLGQMPAPEADIIIEEAYQDLMEDYPAHYLSDYAAIHLGEICMKQGRRIEACAYFGRFLINADSNDSRIAYINEQCRRNSDE